MDVRSLAKGLLATHLGLDEAGLADAFPDSGVAAPTLGLMRT